MLGFWIVLQVISQVSVVEGAGGVAYMAHIGGFVAGVVLIFLFGRRHRLGRGAHRGCSGRRLRG